MSFDFSLTDGDLSINPDGKIKTVTDTPKLRQDVLKIILTPIGSVRFHPWYGCTVTESIVGRGMPDNLIQTEVQASVSQALERLKQLQRAQATTQRVTAGETLSNIGEIAVNRSLQDPRQLNVIVQVITRQLTKIEEIFTIIS